MTSKAGAQGTQARLPAIDILRISVSFICEPTCMISLICSAQIQNLGMYHHQVKMTTNYRLLPLSWRCDHLHQFRQLNDL